MESLISVKSQSWLPWFYKGVLVLALFILFSRMFELQIIKGNYFRSLSEGNRIRKIPIPAPRGKIIARGGEVLVGNREGAREYILGPDMAHVSGYLSEINEEEVGKVDPECLEKGPRQLGQLTGRSGLEEEYECTLRGIDGEELVEVDTLGKKIRTLGTRPPVPGTDIKTTIDLGLQKRLAEAFRDPKQLIVKKNQKGAGVITDPQGQILAFYSSPSFDPTDITKSLTDPELPLFNRVIGGSYHPGSTFKIVTATAGLESEKIDSDYKYDDTGEIKVNEFSYTNWYFTQYGRTEGVVSLVKAIARSTDTFFYKLGEIIGIRELVSWSKKYGYGALSGIDLPGETAGLVPDPEWKERVKGENWFLGNTYHMAIGQGDLTATPLQVNIASVVVANGGKLCTPYIGEISKEGKCRDIGIESASLNQIKEGMVEACSTGGTGYPFFEWNEKRIFKVACKTGTAETEEEDKTHAWFTVFAPSESPEIIATFLVEKGGEGSSVAAPIAREVLDYWYLQKNP